MMQFSHALYRLHALNEETPKQNCAVMDKQNKIKYVWVLGWRWGGSRWVSLQKHHVTCGSRAVSHYREEQLCGHRHSYTG